MFTLQNTPGVVPEPGSVALLVGRARVKWACLPVVAALMAQYITA